MVSGGAGWFQEGLCVCGFTKVVMDSGKWFQERLGGFRKKLGGFRKGWVVSGWVAVSEKTGWFQVGVDLKLFGGRQPPLMLGRVMIQAKVHLV